MPYAVRICRNTSKTQNKSKGITFHRFPADPIQRDKWASVLRKCRHDEYWIPYKYTYICSAHFKHDDIYVTDRGIRRFSNRAYPKLNLYSENFEAYPIVEHCLPPAQFETHNITEEAILSDENSQQILDTPGVACLKAQISKKDILLCRYVRKIRALQATIRRLTKKNDFFKDIIRKIKKTTKINPPAHELNDTS